jgi:hypothetical protein
MGAYQNYSVRWLLVAAVLAISGGASLAPPQERAGAAATRAAADTSSAADEASSALKNGILDLVFRCPLRYCICSISIARTPSKIP